MCKVGLGNNSVVLLNDFGIILQSYDMQKTITKLSNVTLVIKNLKRCDFLLIQQRKVQYNLKNKPLFRIVIQAGALPGVPSYVEKKSRIAVKTQIK